MSNRALAFTADQLLQTLKSFPAVNFYLVGFSGGADSTALLHAISKIRKRLNAPVSAVHINHGIHPDADAWQRQCEDFCQQHAIDLVCRKVVLSNNAGKGLEAEARHLRYEAISGMLNKDGCLLTAHHADDQAETLLLNLMRGSGVDGLTAMPESRPLDEGFLQRPLLNFRSSALRDYLRDNNIEWTEDPSNEHLNHDRNFVRHQVIPLLEQRWPEVNQRLLLTLHAMTDARYLLEALADDYLRLNHPHPWVLKITPQCLSNPQLTKLVIRRWIKQSGTTGIPAYTLDALCEQLQVTGSDHKVAVRWGDWSLHWYRGHLWLQAVQAVPPCPTAKWAKGTTDIDLGQDIGRLVFERAGRSIERSRNSLDRLPGPGLTVGARSNTQESTIRLGGHHKSLKNLFQSAGIPPWLRDSIPLCLLNGEIVSIGDWCFNEDFARSLTENDMALNWRPEHPLLKYILQQQHEVKG
jgi:tRNA(Ile)-lysidine synthase